MRTAAGSYLPAASCCWVLTEPAAAKAARAGRGPRHGLRRARCPRQAELLEVGESAAHRLRYLRQYAGRDSTITLNSSSRPRSIAAVQIQICTVLREWKLWTAPGAPKPCAVLLMDAT